jgi:hypothetical protein
MRRNGRALVLTIVETITPESIRFDPLRRLTKEKKKLEIMKENEFRRFAL